MAANVCTVSMGDPWHSYVGSASVLPDTVDPLISKPLWTKGCLFRYEKKVICCLTPMPEKTKLCSDKGGFRYERVRYVRAYCTLEPMTSINIASYLLLNNPGLRNEKNEFNLSYRILFSNAKLLWYF